MSGRRPLTISLVHGTFASGSTWPAIEEELRRQFSGYDLNITYPPWSGGNTVTARLAAASALERHLLALVDARQDADHFIVAHSHGGNIALLALRNPEVRAAVRGVVCLSTPFLVCRPRVFPRQGRELYEGTAFMGVALFLLYLLSHVTWLHNIVASAVATAVALACAMPLFLRWHRRALDFMHRVTSSPHGTPILVIRSASDEATLLLGTLQATATLLSALWSFLCGGWLRLVIRGLVPRGGAGAFRRVLSATQTMLVFWCFGGFAYFVYAAAVWKTNPFNGSVIERISVASGLVLVAAVNVPFFASMALVVPLLVVTAVLLLPFAPAYAIYSPFIEVSVEQTPDVPSETVPLPWSEDGTVYSDFLQHSRTHDDPQAASLAVDWMRQRLTPPQTVGQHRPPEEVA